MKITNIECVPVQAPGRTLVPILVHTDAGITGVGEAGLQRRWRGIAGVLEHIKKWLIGQDARRIDYLWQRMFRGGFYPGDRLINLTIAGIDIALWDIKGKALGVPVYDLLGGRCRDYVEVFTTPDYVTLELSEDRGDLFKTIQLGADPDATAELAARCKNAGHKFFRLGVPVKNPPEGFDPRWGVRMLAEQLRAVRKRVGGDLELMVDLHARLSPEDSLLFCKEVEPLGMYAVEDPVRAEHLSAYHRLRKHTTVPLAAGEQWAHKWEFQQAIENELIDFARIDICIAGGITEAKKIAAMAEAHEIKLLMHNPLGPTCTAASLHIDLACDNGGPQEVIYPPHTMLPDVFTCAFEFRDFKLTPPTAPGVGITFNQEGAKKHPADMTEPPHFHRPDGSFNNY